MAGVLFVRSYRRTKSTKPAVECSLCPTTAAIDQNNHHLPDITTLIHGYNANDIVIDSNRFISLQDIRNVI